MQRNRDSKTKKRKRCSTPTEQLPSNREREFRDAESKVEGRIVVGDRDFQHQTRGEIDMKAQPYHEALTEPHS